MKMSGYCKYNIGGYFKSLIQARCPKIGFQVLIILSAKAVILFHLTCEFLSVKGAESIGAAQVLEAHLLVVHLYMKRIH